MQSSIGEILEGKREETAPAVNTFFIIELKIQKLTPCITPLSKTSLRHHLFAQRKFRCRKCYFVECKTNEDCPVEHDQRICDRGVCMGNNFPKLYYGQIM